MLKKKEFAFKYRFSIIFYVKCEYIIINIIIIKNNKMKNERRKVGGV